MFETELPENYEPKCLCVLLLDISRSLGGHIAQLQNSIELFHNEILENPSESCRVELAIITYDNTARIVQQPSLATNFRMPKLKYTSLSSAAMGKAIEEAIILINDRKGWYKITGQPYYRPWIILLTDGEPADAIDLEHVKAVIKDNCDNKNFSFLPIGLEGANMEKLASIALPEIPPARLDSLKSHKLFRWICGPFYFNPKDGDISSLPSPPNWIKGIQI